MMSCGGCHNIHHLTHVVASDWRWYKTLEYVRQTKACRNMLYTFNLYLPIFVTLFWNALRCHFVSTFLHVEHMSAHSLLTPCRWALVFAVLSVQALPLVCFLHIAYDIRMYPLRNFGYIIYEFNPWFNYRATEYLAEHGFAKFFTWYEYDLWYPLGRPIGTTIYPGIAIWEYAEGSRVFCADALVPCDSGDAHFYADECERHLLPDPMVWLTCKSLHGPHGL